MLRGRHGQVVGILYCGVTSCISAVPFSEQMPKGEVDEY